MKRRVLGLLLFLLIVPLFMGCDQTTTQTTVVSSTETTIVALGTVTFEVYTAGDDPATTDVTETEYVSTTVDVEFFEGDTLFDLLDENFTITYEGLATDQYGRYLTSIGSIQPVADNNEFVSFYIDGAYAITGLDFTELTDGAVYAFKLGSY